LAVEVDAREEGGDGKKTAERERERENTRLYLYYTRTM
jgi:hypothetical protein